MNRSLLLFLSCCYLNLALCQYQQLSSPTSKDSSVVMAQAEQNMQATEQSGEKAQAEIDDDNSPMVYITPHDYASSARKHREELLAEGKEVVLESELPQVIGPRGEDESPADYAKRFSDAMNKMIRRGVYILNDQTTHDQAPDMFFIDGHDFDVGPESGITKKEYKEFSECFGRDMSYAEIPERFLRFEVKQPNDEI